MRIRDGDSSDPGWKKVGSGIRDKHPGSATLMKTLHNFEDPYRNPLQNACSGIHEAFDL